MGSSLKFCLIAEGEADLYPRLAPTHEWDTAAGHAVLAAAGGDVLTPDGEPLRYGKAPHILSRRLYRCWPAPAGSLSGSGVQLPGCEHGLAGVGRIAFGIHLMP